MLEVAEESIKIIWLKWLLTIFEFGKLWMILTIGFGIVLLKLFNCLKMLEMQYNCLTTF